MPKDRRDSTRSNHRFFSVLLVLLGVGAVLTSCAAPLQKDVTRGLTEVETTRYAGAVDQQEPHGGSQLPDSADLYEVLRYAALNNPGLKASFHRWKASAERIPQVKSLDDPRLSFGQFFETVETRVGPQKQRFGLSQMFPWFGTLRLRGDIAAHQALIAEQQFQAEEDRLYLEVVTAYSEYYYLERSTLITTELIELVKNAEGVARAKYRAGVGPYADLLRAQVELGRLEDHLIALVDQEKPVVARLNAALNRPMAEPIPKPIDLPFEEVALTDEEFLESVKLSNPSLRALSLLIEQEDRAISLAKRRFLPNFTLGLNYLNTGEALVPGVEDSGKDAVLGMFSINIPVWWGSYGASVREAEARQRAAELEHVNRENQLLSRMKRVLYSFHDAERKISLYRDALVPKARQSLEASSTGYQAGEVDFLSFLDAERVLLTFELAYDRARADQLERMAELRVLVGSAYQQNVDELR